MKNLILRFIFFAVGYLCAFWEYRGAREPAALHPIRYNELEHNRRWGVFVDAKDTTYFDGCLFIFDTVNLEYKRVATVTIQPVK